MVWLGIALLIASVAALLLLQARRYILSSLFLQYVAVSILTAEVGLPAWAAVRLGVGTLAVAIIMLTLRHEAQHHHPDDPTSPGASRRDASAAPATGWTLGIFRGRSYQMGVLALVTVIAYGLAGSYPFPTVTPEVSFAAYWLGGVAFLSLMISRTTLRLGLSLLLLDSAIQLLGSAALPERRLIELSLGGSIAILLALAISFLIALESEANQPSERQQGR